MSTLCQWRRKQKSICSLFCCLSSNFGVGLVGGIHGNLHGVHWSSLSRVFLQSIACKEYEDILNDRETSLIDASRPPLRKRQYKNLKLRIPIHVLLTQIFENQVVRCTAQFSNIEAESSIGCPCHGGTKNSVTSHGHPSWTWSK